jgi:hypothetical protein
MAHILPFPKRHRLRQGLVIPLYTDEEIDITVAAINVHGNNPGRVTADTLKDLDADSVRLCLQMASVDHMFSTGARSLLCSILANIECVDYRHQM